MMDNLILEVNLLQIINTAGVIGILLVMVTAFARGFVIPKGVMETMMREADNRARIVASELKNGIEEAVERGIARGIVEGIKEVRKMERAEK